MLAHPNAGMMDIGYSGPRFTWSRGKSSSRLDRMLVNDAWYGMFPSASVTHIPRFKSDHNPLWIKLAAGEARGNRNRPFRFFAPWPS